MAISYFQRRIASLSKALAGRIDALTKAERMQHVLYITYIYIILQAFEHCILQNIEVKAALGRAILLASASQSVAQCRNVFKPQIQNKKQTARSVLSK